MHRLVEAEAKENARRPCRSSVGIYREQPIMYIAKPVRIAAVLGLVHQPCALDICRKHRFERSCSPGGRLLRNIAQPRAPRHVDGSLVRIDQADDCLHQGGLAGAVPPDQANVRPRRNRRRCAVKDRAPAEANRKATDCQHGAHLTGNHVDPKAEHD